MGLSAERASVGITGGKRETRAQPQTRRGGHRDGRAWDAGTFDRRGAMGLAEASPALPGRAAPGAFLQPPPARRAPSPGQLIHWLGRPDCLAPAA